MSENIPMPTVSLDIRTRVTEIEVKNLELKTYPVTVFIEPNASGKSLILRTLATTLQNNPNKIKEYSEYFLHGNLEGEISVKF